MGQFCRQARFFKPTVNATHVRGVTSLSAPSGGAQGSGRQRNMAEVWAESVEVVSVDWTGQAMAGVAASSLSLRVYGDGRFTCARYCLDQSCCSEH